MRNFDPLTLRWSLSRNSKSGLDDDLSPTVRQPDLSQKYLRRETYWTFSAAACAAMAASRFQMASDTFPSRSGISFDRVLAMYLKRSTGSDVPQRGPGPKTTIRGIPSVFRRRMVSVSLAMISSGGRPPSPSKYRCHPPATTSVSGLSFARLTMAAAHLAMQDAPPPPSGATVGGSRPRSTERCRWPSLIESPLIRNTGPPRASRPTRAQVVHPVV